MPYHCEDSRVDRWAADTLNELLSDNSSDSAVEIVPTVVLKRHHNGPTLESYIENKEGKRDEGHDDASLPQWTRDPRLSFQHVTVEMLTWQNSIHRLRIPSEADLKEAGYMHAWLFRPPIVDAPRMLEKLLIEIESDQLTKDIDLATKYRSMDEMIDDAKALGCDVVVICTGLGSQSLCRDMSLVGARGAVLNYDRRCERRGDAPGSSHMVNDAAILVEEGLWGSERETAYLIPRGDVCVVGGTYLEGDAETSLREEEKERLTKNAWKLGIDTNKATPQSSWIGFRPYRPTTCLEVDENLSKKGVKVVMNYGHGGSGWTVFAGAAKDAANLVVGNAN